MGENDEQMQERMREEKTTKPCDGKAKPNFFFEKPKARELVWSSQNSVIAIKPQAAQVTIFIYPSHFK